MTWKSVQPRAAIRLAVSVLVTSVFLGSMGFSQLAHAKTSTKNVENESPVRLLRLNEINLLSGAEKFHYIEALSTAAALLEDTTGGNDPNRYALLDWLIPESYAAVKVGDQCIIGGYISSWYKRRGGGLSCQAPTEEQLFDVNPPRTFFCGKTKSGQRMAYCNSATSLYANDSGERHCEPLRNHSANCRVAFLKRYGQRADPKFPEKISRDIAKFARGFKNPADVDKYYESFEQVLNDLAKQKTPDRKTAAILQSTLKTIRESKKMADNVAPKPTKLAASAAGDGEAPAAAPAEPSAEEAAKGPESKLLGSELSCVRDGLKAAGINASERYIAFLAMGAQASSGPYDTNQTTAKAGLQMRVISMVQAYGACSEEAYPSESLKPNDASTIRRWITADGGRSKNLSGLNYVSQMTSLPTKPVGASALVEAFGFRQEGAAKAVSKGGPSEGLDQNVEAAMNSFFVQPAKNWSQYSVEERQRAMASWTQVDSKSELAKCLDETKKMRAENEAFRFSSVHQGPAAKDGTRPATTAAERAALIKVTEANVGVCQKMAEACGIPEGDRNCGAAQVAAPATSDGSTPPGGGSPTTPRRGKSVN